MKIGNNSISDVLIGEAPINKVMYGSLLVWERVQAIIAGSLWMGEVVSTKHIEVPALTLLNGQAYTIQFWVYAPTKGTNSRQVPLSFNTGSTSSSNIILRFPHTDGNFYADFGNNSTLRASGSFAGRFDQWQQVTVTFSGTASGTLKVYFNAVLAVTKTGTPQLGKDWTGMTIGYGLLGTSSQPSNGGKFSSLRILNTEMQQAEVDATWDKVLPADYPNLLAQWPLFSGVVEEAATVEETTGFYNGLMRKGNSNEFPTYSEDAPPFTPYV